MIVARELAKRYADQGILSLSVNPGMHASHVPEEEDEEGEGDGGESMDEE